MAPVLALCVALFTVLPAACGPSPPGSSAGESPEDGAETDERARTRTFWRLYRQANDARAAGHRGSAVRGFEAALEIDPDHGDALHYLAQLRLERDEVGRARRLLRRLVATEAVSLRGLQQLAVALGIPRPGWAADLPAALETVRRAVDIHPENSGPRVLEARLAAYLGDEAAAREAEMDALGRVPGHAGAHALSIWRAMAASRPERAREAAIRALAAACADPASAGSRCTDQPRLHLLISSLPDAVRPRPGDEEIAGIRLPTLVAPAAPELSLPSPRLTVRVAPSSPRPGSDGNVVVSGMEVVRADLDGDGRADLLAAGEPGQPARLATAAADGGGPHLLPAGDALTAAWSRETAGAIPWRGTVIEDGSGRALVLVGGGAPGVRLFCADGDLWRRARSEGLPDELPGAVLAAADWNGDGATDLFLGNLPAQPMEEGTAGGPEADMVGRLYVQRAPKRFEAAGPAVPGPLQAALAVDVDADGDTDLLVARKLAAEEAARGQLLLPRPRVAQSRGSGLAADGISEGGALALWRNDGGRLVADPEAVPYVAATVQDLAAADLDGDDLPEIYVATGSLVPEYPEADRLLDNRSGRLVDVSQTLGRWRLAGTLRVWASGPGFELLRGGTVPADVRTRRFLAWSRGAAEGH